ncbi:MAG: (deoxy)nucleoside triphosphate pyrophosphohydrolase [Bacteroidota bacterium]
MKREPGGMSPIDVTCAIIVQNGQILATRRSESMPHPLKWEFPGGKVKGNESASECISREIMEELGVGIVVERPLSPVVHHYDAHSVRLIPFICTLEQGDISLSEHQECRWIPCHELDAVDWLDADVEVAAEVQRLRCQ